jgi:hypothetical protein
MTIQTVEAWNHGIHRDFTDVVLFGVIGGVLLALSPAKQIELVNLARRQNWGAEVAGQRHQAHHGASHAGAQDCSHYADLWKKGENFDPEKLKSQTT